jgi:hypothetical protein
VTVFPILAAFTGLVIWTVILLRRLHFDDLTFIDGILIGTAYFLICPLSLALLTGEMPALLLRTESYRPYQDVGVTIMLFMGWLTVLFAKIACDRLLRNSPSVRPLRRHDLIVALCFYIICGTLSFFLLGKNTAGHWMENAALAFSRDIRAVFFGNASTVLRGALFGFLILLAERRQISRQTAVITGLLIVVFDLFTTFNRISAAHYVIMLLIIYRSRIWLLLTGCVLMTPVASSLSVMWTTTRAFLLQGGLSKDSISVGVQMGSKLTSNTLFDRLNGLFEGDSIVVFSFIVKNVPRMLEPLWGQTYFLRTFTVFLPSVVWPDKPITFGSVIGVKLQSIQLLTLSSTLFGEPYGNFYILWIPALLLMLVLFQWIFCLFSRVTGVASCFAVFAGFSAWRYEFSSVTISLTILVIFIILQLAGSFLMRILGGHRTDLSIPSRMEPARPESAL